MKKNWGLSVDLRLAVGVAVFSTSHPFAEHTSLLLTCSGFTRIQKAVVDQTGSRPPNSDLFCCKFGFGKGFGASSPTHLV